MTSSLPFFCFFTFAFFLGIWSLKTTNSSVLRMTKQKQAGGQESSFFFFTLYYKFVFNINSLYNTNCLLDLIIRVWIVVAMVKAPVLSAIWWLWSEKTKSKDWDVRDVLIMCTQVMHWSDFFSPLVVIPGHCVLILEPWYWSNSITFADIAISPAQCCWCMM